MLQQWGILVNGLTAEPATRRNFRLGDTQAGYFGMVNWGRINQVLQLHRMETVSLIKVKTDMHFGVLSLESSCEILIMTIFRCKSLDQITCQQSRQHVEDARYSSLLGLKGT